MELYERLYRLHRFGIRPGLERITALLDAVGQPQRDFACVHVTGTNGKGSVCALIASMLRAQGYRVGLYTSPHLLRLPSASALMACPLPRSSCWSCCRRCWSVGKPWGQRFSR
jgi:dihydrofolate synthase/folylpolyglutamate synthase